MTTFIKDRDGTPKHYCKACNCWVDARKQSMRVHEEGKKHKENASRKIAQMHRSKRLARIEQENSEGQFLGINLAAVNAYAGDMKNGVAGHSQEFEALRSSVIKGGKPKPGAEISRGGKPKPGAEIQSIYDTRSGPIGGVDYVAKYNKEYGHAEAETVIVPGALPPGLFDQYGDAVGPSLERFKLESIKDTIARKAKEAWDKVKAERKAEQEEKQRNVDQEKQRLEKYKKDKLEAPPGMSKQRAPVPMPNADISKMPESEQEMIRDIQSKVTEVQEARRARRVKGEVAGGDAAASSGISIKEEEKEWMEAFDEWAKSVPDEDEDGKMKDPSETITDAEGFRKEHPDGEMDEDTGMGGWIQVKEEDTILDAVRVTPLSDIRKSNKRARNAKEADEDEAPKDETKRRVAPKSTKSVEDEDDEETAVDAEADYGFLPRGVSSILAAPKAVVEEEAPADESELQGIKFKKKKVKEKGIRRPTA